MHGDFGAFPPRVEAVCGASAPTSNVFYYPRIFAYIRSKYITDSIRYPHSTIAHSSKALVNGKILPLHMTIRHGGPDGQLQDSATTSEGLAEVDSL